MNDQNLLATKNDDSKKKKPNEKSETENMLKLHNAVKELSIDEVSALLENNVYTDQYLNVSLLRTMALYKPSNEALEIITILLNHGADPSTPLSQLSTINCNMKNEKTTAFQYAASKGLDLVNTLLKYIKCANHKDSLNRNAIFYAILTDRGDNADIVKRLIDSGVKVNEKESVDGNTPLIIASSKSLKDSVKALLEGGADPNIQNNAGNTALHMATNIDIVNLLLSYHANIEIKNRDGENSIELASFRNKTNIYEVLVREKNSRETKEKNLASELEQERQERSLNLSVNNNLNKKSLKATNNTSRSIEHIQTTPNQTYYQPGGQQNNYSPNQVNKIMHSNSGTINDKSSQNTFSIDSQSLIIKPNQSINSQMNFNGNSLNHNSNPYLYKNMSEIGLNNTVSENHMPYRSYNNNSSAINDGGVSYNNQSQNISININNMQTFNNHNSNRKVRNGGRIRFTKSKLAKKTFYNESNGAFNKVFNDSGYPQSNIEIPFNFIKNSSKIDVNNNNNQSQLHTYIKMQNLPILNIDISNDHKEMQLINSQYADDSSKRGEINEKRFRQIIEENIAIKDINEKLQKQLIEKEDELNRLRQAYSKIDTDQKETIIEQQHRLDELARINNSLIDKLEKYELKQIELGKKNLELQNEEMVEFGRRSYLEKKFSIVKYDMNFIYKCLQKDVLDFQEFNKEVIRKQRPIQEELLRLIQEAVSEVTKDFEVNIYGSHATNLCLPWSDLDLVLVHKKYPTHYCPDTLRAINNNIKEKSWIQTIKFIDGAQIPIIKITTTDQYQSIQIDISMQDNRHYGLKCVELVLSFVKEYEALEPLIFSLKNILKNANLNDPYTGGLSSYGLILMVVSFLQNQLDHKKKIDISGHNLGALFIDFLFYYGWMFDHTKYVIVANPPNDSIYQDKDFIFPPYNNSTMQNELVIMDPLNKNNNVARSTYQFGNIKMAFMLGYVVSHEECECGCHYTSSELDLTNTNNSEHCILKRIFNSVKRFNGNNPIAGVM